MYVIFLRPWAAFAYPKFMVLQISLNFIHGYCVFCPFRCPQQKLSRSVNYFFFIAFRGVKRKWIYVLREMRGHMVKKNTLYFEVRHTIYLFAIDVY